MYHRILSGSGWHFQNLFIQGKALSILYWKIMEELFCFVFPLL